MTAFNVWYFSQSEPMRIAMIGAVVTLWSTITAGVIAFLVAWVQARMAQRTIETQERTIFLSLIDRRARWFDEAMLLWSSWISEQERLIEHIVRNEEPQTAEPIAKIAVSRREANWLFGPEIIEHLNVLETAVREYGQKRMRVRELGLMGSEERSDSEVKTRYDEFSASLMAAMSQQALLAKMVSPYLDVADIKGPSVGLGKRSR